MKNMKNYIGELYKYSRDGSTYACLMTCMKANRKTKLDRINLTRLSKVFNKQLRNVLRILLESLSVRDSIIIRYGHTLLS